MGTFIVTGGGRGIGAAISRLAGSLGHNVLVNYSASETAAQKVVSDIHKSGGKAIAVKADMRRDADIAAMFEAADKAFGACDVMVNNAGVDLELPLAEFPTDDIERIISTNVTGLIICAREGVRRMAKSRGGKGGVIVNIGSVAARTGGLPNDTVYTASKGAVDTFTHALSNEVAPDGIRVVCVRPGIVLTEIFDSGIGQDAAAEFASKHVPIRRAGTPDEIAGLVLWLCSKEAGFVTGFPIDISGGR